MPQPPRTGRALILATKPFEQESVPRSWFELISTTAVYALLLAVVVLAQPLALRVLAAVLAGLVQFRFFALFHDHVHGSLLARSRVGKAIMSALGLLLLAPRKAWKESHDFHHQNNGKIKWAAIGSYPVMTPTQLEQATPAARRKYQRRRHPLAIVGGYLTVGIGGLCLEAYRRAPRRHYAGPIALAIHVVGLGLLAWIAGPLTAVLVWVVPLVVDHGFSAYVFYAQHNFPQTRFFETSDWDYTEAALHGSSLLEMGPVMRWITANIGYHHVHHLNHKIPFYRLPRAMAALPELQAPHRTTLRPSDVLACLRLHTWDPEQGRMRAAGARPIRRRANRSSLVLDDRPLPASGTISTT